MGTGKVYIIATVTVAGMRSRIEASNVVAEVVVATDDVANAGSRRPNKVL